MSEIQIKGSELDALANELANAESQATTAARSLVWHISSLTVGITQASTAQIEAVKDELEYSIKQYSNGLDELQAYVRYTKAKMEEADRKIMAQLSILGGEMLGMSDVQRIFAEHDPVTSESISIGHRVLETGMVMLALVPTLKGGAVAARTGTVFHSLKMSDEAKLLVQSTRNVLDTKVVKNFGIHTYESVKNGAIAWTGAASKGYKGIIKSPIPQLVSNLLSIGAPLPQKMMEQAFKEANSSVVKSIKSNKGIHEGHTSLHGTNNTLAGTQLSKTKDAKARDIDRTNSSHITIKNGKVNNSGNVKAVKSIEVFDEIEGEINGKYHLYENGQIIFEHPEKNGGIVYKEVNKVPNNQVGGVKELDSWLSGTNLEVLEYIDPRSWGRKAVLGVAKKFSIKEAKKEVGKVTKKTYKNLKYDAETKQWKYENGKPIRPNQRNVETINKQNKNATFKSNEQTISHPVLSVERTGSALKKPDGQHGFNDIIDNYTPYAKNFDFIGGDKVERKLYQIEGGRKYYKSVDVYDKELRMDVRRVDVQNDEGIFEWIVDPAKGVTHRRFIPNGEITGLPNQIVKK